jgi:hypothetical protein
MAGAVAHAAPLNSRRSSLPFTATRYEFAEVEKFTHEYTPEVCPVTSAAGGTVGEAGAVISKMLSAVAPNNMADDPLT